VSRSITLSAEDVEVIQQGLYAAKFALEQDSDGREKDEAIKKINEALDHLRDAR
jgi:hypothetical protein